MIDVRKVCDVDRERSGSHPRGLHEVLRPLIHAEQQDLESSAEVGEHAQALERLVGLPPCEDGGFRGVEPSQRGGYHLIRPPRDRDIARGHCDRIRIDGVGRSGGEEEGAETETQVSRSQKRREESEDDERRQSSTESVQPSTLDPSAVVDPTRLLEGDFGDAIGECRRSRA